MRKLSHERMRYDILPHCLQQLAREHAHPAYRYTLAGVLPLKPPKACEAKVTVAQTSVRWWGVDAEWGSHPHRSLTLKENTVPPPLHTTSWPGKIFWSLFVLSNNAPLSQFSFTCEISRVKMEPPLKSRAQQVSSHRLDSVKKCIQIVTAGSHVTPWYSFTAKTTNVLEEFSGAGSRTESMVQPKLNMQNTNKAQARSKQPKKRKGTQTYQLWSGSGGACSPHVKSRESNCSWH